MSGEAEGRRPLLLFIAPYFPPAYYGGVVQVYLGLLERLKVFDITVVTDRHGCTMDEQKRWDAQAMQAYGICVRRIGSFELHLSRRAGNGRLRSWLNPFVQAKDTFTFFLRGRRDWKALLNELRPDLVICGGTYSAGWLTQSLPREIALVNYLHGEELTMRVSPRFLMPYMRRWQMRSIRRAELNIAVSHYTAALTESLAEMAPASVEVLPNFVDAERFRVSGMRAELRAALGWEQRLVILTLARLVPRKGIDQALRALAMLQREERLLSDWMYVIAGRGEQQETLEGLSRALGIADRVFFRGFVRNEEIAGLYEAADIFLQPNREMEGDTEGFGVVFLEASACGLPVIGGTAGGTADAIEEGVSGYRVDGESVDEIASAVWRLAADGALRRRLGAQGAERVARRFSVEEAALRFRDLLLGVLARRGGGR